MSTISHDVLIEYYRAGFKPIPLSKDAKTPNVRGLLTPDEEAKSREESADGQIHEVSFIYNHPEFWTEERIKKEYWRFDNVATTLGKTLLTDDQGKPLYLNALDIDSEQVFTSLPFSVVLAAQTERMFILLMKCAKIPSYLKLRRDLVGISFGYLTNNTNQSEPDTANTGLNLK